MCKLKPILNLLFVGILFSSCSNIQIIDSWTANPSYPIKNNRTLVVARTKNKVVRMAFEDEIAKAFKKKGIHAEESYKTIPKLNPDEKLTPEKKEKIKTMLLDQGYKSVVLSVIKDSKADSVVVREGGYYIGDRRYFYGPYYHHGFFDYYFNPYSYSTYGAYVPEYYSTEITRTYILETVIYHLDQPKEEQLAAIVQSKIIDPGLLQKTAHQYAKSIVKEIDQSQ